MLRYCPISPATPRLAASVNHSLHSRDKCGRQVSRTAVESEYAQRPSGRLNRHHAGMDAAAEGLSKHKGGSLSLDGLTSLLDAAAESLSKCHWRLQTPTKLMRKIMKFS